MRLGKPMEHLQAALRAIHTSADAGEQITTIGRQLGYFGYLAYDAIVWVRSYNKVLLIYYLIDVSCTGQRYQILQLEAFDG